MQFVKEGETIKQQQTQAASILDRAQSLEMVVDLKRRLVFPSPDNTTPRHGDLVGKGQVSGDG
ncbi:hypothetical protein DPMN_108526 [Dreissena polymorpha]|uniref:Uncharacterized protein n=1 Tax=Dreissena polymorpha TaxID=45954 RepID=A0A9D4K905_DREPO|nr:hypothetical protein DPMN_108526 [Dreissena polymorpha]